MKGFQLRILRDATDLDLLDDNVDIEVELSDGRVFSATFFTIENIKSLLCNYRRSGECANGSYLWAEDMIIVEKLTQEVMATSVDDLIKSGEITTACTEIS